MFALHLVPLSIAILFEFYYCYWCCWSRTKLSASVDFAVVQSVVSSFCWSIGWIVVASIWQFVSFLYVTLPAFLFSLQFNLFFFSSEISMVHPKHWKRFEQQAKIIRKGTVCWVGKKLLLSMVWGSHSSLSNIILFFSSD